VTLPGVDDAVVDPACYLDECSQADGGLIPAPLVDVDRRIAVLLVAAHEPLGKATPCGADDRTKRPETAIGGSDSRREVKATSYVLGASTAALQSSTASSATPSARRLNGWRSP
jgi:hypothetical protein